jgi:hypothetical protein
VACAHSAEEVHEGTSWLVQAVGISRGMGFEVSWTRMRRGGWVRGAERCEVIRQWYIWLRHPRGSG